MLARVSGRWYLIADRLLLWIPDFACTGGQFGDENFLAKGKKHTGEAVRIMEWKQRRGVRRGRESAC